MSARFDQYAQSADDPAPARPAALPTPQQIALVQESFELVQPMALAAASVFYDRLFSLDPGLRRLFPADLEAQKRKLMQVLAAGVRGLTRPEPLLAALRDLGRRHNDYGVRPEDYQTVGAALLWTLERGLGDAFGPDLRAAWTAVYDLMAGAMQEGASEAGPEQLAAA
jgi:hemoglobin-like flavoprotein